MKTFTSQTRQEIVMSVIKARRSTRHFVDSPIPEAEIRDLVEAGVYAPSASNAQNQRFLIVTDRSEIERLGRLRYVWPYPNHPEGIRERKPAGILGHALALIIVFADASLSDRRLNGEYHIWETMEIQNCAASIQNILLLASAKGIANCWVSATEGMTRTRLLSGRTWRQVLEGYDIPDSYKIQGIVLLGWPKEVDAEGFPKGEKKHGASCFSEIARKPVEHYLIGRKGGEATHTSALSITERFRVRGYSTAIRVLESCVRMLDRSIARIETSKFVE